MIRAMGTRRRVIDRSSKASPAEGQWMERVPALIAQAALLALLAVSPWAFGGIHANFQQWCFAPLLIGLLCWAVVLTVQRKTKQVLPLAIVPLLLALALGGMQLLPVSESLRSFFSPRATQLREALAPANQAPTEMPPGTPRAPAVTASVGSLRQPLTIYPAATRRQLALLSMATIAFALGARFFRHRRAQLVLCVTAAVNGAAIAILGIVQRISRDYSYFGGSDHGSFGSFFNENNAAGYLNLCLACGLAVLYWLLIHNRAPQAMLFADGLSLEPQPAASPWAQSWSSARAAVASLSAPALAIWIVLGLLLAGVLCSLSRGAWLAFAIAAPLTLWMARRQTGLKSAWVALGLAATVSMALVYWLGVSKLIGQRSASLLSPSGLLGDGRVSNWAESCRALGDYWMAGSGLGTYGYAYLPYQQQYNNSWHLHAENQYLEALVDGGLVGLALLACQIALVVVALRKIRADRSEPASAGVLMAGMFLILTQSVHALVDFGLYLPANFLLMAVVCGGICGRAALLAQNPDSASRRYWVALPGAALLAPAVMAGLLVAGVFGWQQTSRAAVVENALAAARWDDADRRIPLPKVEQAVDRLSAAVRNRWGDADAHLRLAQLWIQLYRLHALAELRRESPSADETSLWNLTDLAQLHGRAAELASVKNTVQLGRLRQQPAIADYLPQAWKHLLWARQACPWLAQPHLELAAICFLAGDPLADQTHLDRVRLLADYDPHDLFAMALFDLNDDRTAQAYREFKQSWSEELYYHYSILAIMSRRLTTQQMLDQVVPASPEVLIKMARESYQGPEKARDRKLIMDRAEQLLATLPMDPADRYHIRAGLALLRNQLPEAIADLREATQLRPANGNWRSELATLLQKVAAANAALKTAPNLQPSLPQGGDRGIPSPIGMHP
jgi:O-antigen ligase